MALRYLARRVGIPALQRASAPRGSPSRLVATRSSQQALINESKAAASNRNNEPELLYRDFVELTDEEIRQEIAKLKSISKEAGEDLKEFMRYQNIRRWCMMGSSAAGAGLAFFTIACSVRHETEIDPSLEG